jgi:hypothetical protein
LALLGFLLIPLENYVIQILTNVLWRGAHLWMALASWQKFEPEKANYPEKD